MKIYRCIVLLAAACPICAQKVNYATQITNKPVRDVRDYGARPAVTLGCTVTATGTSVTASVSGCFSLVHANDYIAITGPAVAGTGTLTTAPKRYASPYVEDLRVGATATGSGTNFSSFAVGGYITVGSETRVITSIASSSSLVLYPLLYPQVSAPTAYTYEPPRSYVKVLSVSGVSITLTASLPLSYTNATVKLAPDNYDAFYNAFNSGFASHIPEGDWFVRNTADHMPSNCSIVITGLRGGVEFSPSARIVFTNHLDRIGYTFSGVSDITFKNVNITYLNQGTKLQTACDAVGTYATAASWGLQNSKNVVIDGFTAKGIVGFSFQSKVSSRIQARNVLIERGSRDGWTNEDCDQCSLSDAIIKYVEDDGIGWHRHTSSTAEGGTLSNVQCYGVTGACPDIDGFVGLSVSNLYNKGSGNGIAIIDSANSPTAPERITVSNFVVEDLISADPNTAAPVDANGIILNNTKSVSISSGTIRGIPASNGITQLNDTTTGADIRISDVHVSNAKHCVYMDLLNKATGGNITLRNIDTSTCYGSGFYLQRIGNVYADNLTATNTSIDNAVGVTNAFYLSEINNVLVGTVGVVDTQVAGTGYSFVENAIGYGYYNNIWSRMTDVAHPLGFVLSTASTILLVNGKPYDYGKTIKFNRTIGCSLTTGAGNTCTGTLTWNGNAFADTNYTPVCTAGNVVGTVAAGITTYTTSAVNYKLTNVLGGTASAEVYCMAMKN